MNKLLLSMLVGIGIGILLAPEKGSATLKKLKGKLGDMADCAEDEADELLAKGKRAFKKGKAAFSDSID